MYARRGFLRLDLNIQSPTTSAPDSQPTASVGIKSIQIALIIVN